MTVTVRRHLPVPLPRGILHTITRAVHDSDNSEETASAGTISIFDAAGIALVDGVDLAGNLGPPATYDVAAATTADEPYSDDWRILWALTIDGVVRYIEEPAYLVRSLPYGLLTDTDLTDRYNDLSDLLATGEGEKKRRIAAQYIERKLIKGGRRPWQIWDAYQLEDAYVAKTLELLFRDWSSRTGNGHWGDLANHHAEEFKAEMHDLKFRYDRDEDGKVDDSTWEPGRGPLVITAGNPRGRSGY